MFWCVILTKNIILIFLGIFRPVMDKYNTKTTSRWHKVSVLMSDALNRSFNPLSD